MTFILPMKERKDLPLLGQARPDRTVLGAVYYS
jgi:hypothetical protein